MRSGGESEKERERNEARVCMYVYVRVQERKKRGEKYKRVTERTNTRVESMNELVS